MEMTSKQRAWLRSKASTLDTIFQIGKGGVNENMLKQMEDALEARELIKCKVLENCEYSPREAADGIAAAIDAAVVTVIGSKFVLFKISPTKRQYDLLNMKMIESEDKKKKAVAKPASKNVKPGYKAADKGTKGTKTPAKSSKPSRPSAPKSGEKSNYRIIKKNSK